MRGAKFISVFFTMIEFRFVLSMRAMESEGKRKKVNRKWGSSNLRRMLCPFRFRKLIINYSNLIFSRSYGVCRNAESSLGFKGLRE